MAQYQRIFWQLKMHFLTETLVVFVFLYWHNYGILGVQFSFQNLNEFNTYDYDILFIEFRCLLSQYLFNDLI